MGRERVTGEDNKWRKRKRKEKRVAEKENLRRNDVGKGTTKLGESWGYDNKTNLIIVTFGSPLFLLPVLHLAEADMFLMTSGCDRVVSGKGVRALASVCLRLLVCYTVIITKRNTRKFWSWEVSLVDVENLKFYRSNFAFNFCYRSFSFKGKKSCLCFLHFVGNMMWLTMEASPLSTLELSLQELTWLFSDESTQYCTESSGLSSRSLWCW
jgi:hypothetical protein